MRTTSGQTCIFKLNRHFTQSSVCLDEWAYAFCVKMLETDAKSNTQRYLPRIRFKSLQSKSICMPYFFAEIEYHKYTRQYNRY